MREVQEARKEQGPAEVETERAQHAAPRKGRQPERDMEQELAVAASAQPALTIEQMKQLARMNASLASTSFGEMSLAEPLPEGTPRHPWPWPSVCWH